MAKRVDPRKTRRYQNLASAFLRRTSPACHWCGITTLRTVEPGHPLKATVDHLVEVDANPEACMDTSMWVVACWTCNASRGGKYASRKKSSTLLTPARPPSREW